MILILTNYKVGITVSEWGAGTKRRSGACGGGRETRDVGASMAECAGGRLGTRGVADRRGPWAKRENSPMGGQR